MQKISTYLYPNRIQLLADLAGFNTEYTNVYQRNIKIYQGINNTLEFEFKNADQKRISITPYSTLTLMVLDQSGNEAFQEVITQADVTLNGTSIARASNIVTVTVDKDYGLKTGDLVSFVTSGITVSSAAITVTDISTFTVASSGATVANITANFAIDCIPSYLKGIGRATILASDLATFEPQTFIYSVSDTYSNIMFYGDTQFGASGKITLYDNALPATRKARVYSSFIADLSYSSLINEYLHSSPIPIRFYEAIPTTSAQLDFVFSSLQGTVTIEVTSDATISNESFPANANPILNPDGTPAAVRRGKVIDTFTVSNTDVSASKIYTGLADYTYMRVSYLRESVPVNGAWLPGTGKITKITITNPPAFTPAVTSGEYSVDGGGALP